MNKNIAEALSASAKNTKGCLYFFLFPLRFFCGEFEWTCALILFCSSAGVFTMNWLSIPPPNTFANALLQATTCALMPIIALIFFFMGFFQFVLFFAAIMQTILNIL